MIRVSIRIKDEKEEERVKPYTFYCYEFIACQYIIDRRKNLLSTRMNAMAKTMILHFEDIQVEDSNGDIRIYTTVTEEEFNEYERSMG